MLPALDVDGLALFFSLVLEPDALDTAPHPGPNVREPKMMISRRILFCLCLGILLGSSSGASAQLRLFRRSGSRIDPAHERAKTEADQAYQRGDYQRAVKLATSVLRANPRDSVAYYLRASSQAEIGLLNGDSKLIRAGISDARNAIRYDTTGNSLYYIPYLYGMTILARVENRKEHAEVAVQIAGTALKLPGNTPEKQSNILYQRALSRIYLRQFDPAIADFQQAIKLVPKHLGSYLGLANAYVAAGRSQQARTAYNTAVRVFPDDALVHNDRGMFLKSLGRNADAITDFTRALEIDPKYHYAYTNRGFLLMETGHPQAAENDYTASLKIDPRQPTVYTMRASARLAQGHIKSALEDQLQAVQLAPNDPTTYADLGFARFFASQYAEAGTAFDRALKLSPGMGHLLPWRMAVLLLSGDSQQEMDRFRESLPAKSKPTAWGGHLLDYLLGKATEAQLLAAVTNKDTDVRKAQLCEAHYFAGLKQRKEGKPQQADAHFQKALETGMRHLSAYRGAQFALKKFTAVDKK